LRTSVPRVPMLIDGKFVDSKSAEVYDVQNPATGEVIARVPQSTEAEMKAAFENSREAWEDVA
jgi:malonate-semialdehyde dehydrogenase (acetylating)/methylmalonate-semialdehyde dehydrogenase